MNVGMRSRSSRELTNALNVLNAVGGDKDKIKILEEIKNAQDGYERTLSELNTTKKEVEQAQAQAKEIIAKAAALESAARVAQAALQKESETKIKQLKEEKRSIAADRALLDARMAEFDKYVSAKNSAIDKEKADLSLRTANIERRETECAALETSIQKRLAEFAQIDNLMKKSLGG